MDRGEVQALIVLGANPVYDAPGALDFGKRMERVPLKVHAGLYYDETGAVVTDYGAARFLNVEAKRGGRYLPENDSWASATIAHNTLVVDEQSHFAGDWKAGEKSGTRQLAASLEGPTRYAIGEIDSAYKAVRIRRALLCVRVVSAISGLPSEQAGRADEQDDRHDHEDDDAGRLRIKQLGQPIRK